MAESYKNFDDLASLSSTKESVVSIRGYVFRRRDLILGGIAIVALIVCVVLAIVIAVGAYNKDCKRVETAKAEGQKGGSHGGEPSGGGQIDKRNYCSTPGCLRTSYYQVSSMDMSVNPCDDFYSFACKSYGKYHPFSTFMPEVTPRTIIETENTRTLVFMLNGQVLRQGADSYERKVKELMSSCNAHFDKMQLAGKPFIEKVLGPVGGWYVLSTWDAATFDFNSLLKKVHINFWTAAFFGFQVTTDTYNWHKKIIEIVPGGLTLDANFYRNLTSAGKIFDDYKAYMRKVASLLARDTENVDQNSEEVKSRIEIFIKDVLEIETEIAKGFLNSPFNSAAHHPNYTMTISDLGSRTNNTINWLDYIKSAMKEYASRISTSTRVAVYQYRYLDVIGNAIKSRLSDDVGKRKLHNYLIWRLSEHYVHFLNWEYVHANRKLNYDIYNTKDQSDSSLLCFLIAEAAMSDAMNALYVRDHMNDANKNEAMSMLNSVKGALLDSVEKVTWMDRETKDRAKLKISQSLYNVGFSQDMRNEQLMDDKYMDLKIDVEDFFGNMLGLNEMARKYLSQLWGVPDAREAWPYHTFLPVADYINPWHSFILTAGYLQLPLFDREMPHFFNFGSVGSVMGTTLVNAVDAIGSIYRLDRTGTGDWWSNFTNSRYMAVRRCLIDEFSDAKQGPFNVTGLPEEANLDISRRAEQIFAEASGLRLGYKAFKAWEQKNKMEKRPPGFEDKTTDQLYFLSYAQSLCANRPKRFEALAAIFFGRVLEKTRVNLALTQVPEFRKAWKCPNTSRYKPKKECTLF